MKKIQPWQLDLGSRPVGNKVRFNVWAPYSRSAAVRLMSGPAVGVHALQRDESGYFSGEVAGARAGDRYVYVLEGNKERPDPASRFQPEGVHGPSAIVDPSFRWKDQNWKGIPAGQYIFYEIHTGTFTSEGTFEAAIEKIPHLKKLGVTCVEIMPVGQFPGERNWGYDGVGLYAVQNSYGGPEGLKKLVNACHSAGLAVCQDVVYNHLGPEGNYLRDFGPYFSGKYHTPWGDTVNYDDAESNHVRRFIVENALYWITEYHMDALRLDAVHAIYDYGARHILEEIQDAVDLQSKLLGRKTVVIAESDLNDSRLLRPREQGGYHLGGQWSDDFHHSLHVLLTGERKGYYEDFSTTADLAKAVRQSYVYDGLYSRHRRRNHGNSPEGLDSSRFVVASQNHDQVGNRAYGDRLSAAISFELEKTAAVALLCAPCVPLLFMGQEYGETRPFQYFIHHSDPALVKAVQEGRRKEFVSFGWNDIPDPQSEKTFLDSKLGWSVLDEPKSRAIWILYQDLIRLRKKYFRPLRIPDEIGTFYSEKERWAAWLLKFPRRSVAVAVSFAPLKQMIKLPFLKKGFQTVLFTGDGKYTPSGAAEFLLNRREIEMPPESGWVGLVSL